MASVLMGKPGVVLAVTGARGPRGERGATGSGLAAYDTIAQMRAATKATLSDGTYVTVGGYNTRNDGGGGVFVWVADSTEADDSGTVFSALEGGVGRWLRLSIEARFNVQWFGVKGDGATDNATALAAAEAAAYAKGKSLFYPAGVYRFSDVFACRVSCYGEGAGSVLKPTNGSGTDVCVTNEHPSTGFASDIEFVGLKFDGNGTSRGAKFHGGARVYIRSCFADNCLISGFAFYGVDMCKVIDCLITNIRYDAGLTAADGIFFGDCLNPIAERNWISNFERIGIVVDSAGENGSANPRLVANWISDAKNCDKTTDEFNAGIWCEFTSGGIIEGNHIFDIAGNADQTSGRVRGMTVHAIGDAFEAVSVCKGNTVELGDDANRIYTAYSIEGTSERATIQFEGNIARNCARGLEITGGVNVVEIRGFSVDRLTRATTFDGAIILTLTARLNNLLIDGLYLSNTADNVPVKDWADIHLTAVSGTGSIGRMTVRNVHDAFMMMRPGNAACERLVVQGCSLYFGAQTAGFNCLSAMEASTSDTRFIYHGARGNAGLMNQNPGAGVTSRYHFSNCRVVGADIIMAGSGLTEVRFSGGAFTQSSISFDLAENGNRLLSFIGVEFDEYSPTLGAIRANFSPAVAGLKLIVQTCQFFRTSDVTPIRLWNSNPEVVVLQGNVHAATTLTDLTTTSDANNVAI